MLPIDIQNANERYNDMLAEADARRLAKAARRNEQSPPRAPRSESLIARILEVLRPRRAARA